MMAGRRHRDWHGAGRRWRRSLRWRLVTLFVLLALATSAVFLGGVQRVVRSGWQGYAQPLVADYADRLATEIGSPPDPERARAIADRLPITIRIDGPAVNLSTGTPAATGQDHRDGFGLVRQTADGHRIVFGLAAPEPADGSRGSVWSTLAMLLGLTLVAFFAVHRLLRPIEAIGAGVARFGRGDFSQPIRLARRDEIGELAERVNRMAASLQGMLDAKRALLLAISHELRSPLTRARVNAELVEEGEARTALLRDLSAMRDLIDDLLESERLASGHAALQAELVDAAALVRELVADQFGDAGVGLALPPEGCALRADPVRLKLLVRNLVDNALRHGAGAGRAPEVRVEIADGSFRLTVRDFGRGVDAEQLARLAEPFYRPDAARQRATGGVGLGLALSRLVAEAHGGSLTLRRAEPGLEAVAVWPVA